MDVVHQAERNRAVRTRHIMCALALIIGMTGAAPAFAQPLVERPKREICYDPQPRVLCKQRCESLLAQCSLDRPACQQQQAKCVSACPPMVCSRGRKQ